MPPRPRGPCQKTGANDPAGAARAPRDGRPRPPPKGHVSRRRSRRAGAGVGARPRQEAPTLSWGCRRAWGARVCTRAIGRGVPGKRGPWRRLAARTRCQQRPVRAAEKLRAAVGGGGCCGRWTAPNQAWTSTGERECVAMEVSMNDGADARLAGWLRRRYCGVHFRRGGVLPDVGQQDPTVCHSYGRDTGWPKVQRRGGGGL